MGCAAWVSDFIYALKSTKSPGQTHCSSHARKEGTESFLVTAIHLLSPLCSSPGSFLTKHQAPVVPPSWGQLGCWAESRSCLNTALPSCFLNAVWASQQGPEQGLEGARRESLEHGTGQPSPTPFASRPWQGLFLAGDSGEETQQAWEVEGGLGHVSNEDAPGGGEPEGSRLDKIPTVKCGLEASENHGGHSSTGSAVRWRGNKARTPPQWSAAHKIPETFAGFQGIRDRVTSGRERRVSW